jgi:prepilin-type N-terminal cleavage/methylation domain-containing protein
MLKKKAFSLIEILLVMVIIGIMATMALPRLRPRHRVMNWPAVTHYINNMVQFARQQAIADRATYRITFYKKNPKAVDTISIEKQVPDPEKPHTKIWKPLDSVFFATTQELQPEIKFVAAYKNGVEQFDVNKNSAHCYVMHEGLAQEIMLHLTRIAPEDEFEEKGTLIMEPFLGVFEYHEGFTKPAKAPRK